MKANGKGKDVSLKEWPKVWKDVQYLHQWSLGKKGESPIEHDLAQSDSAQALVSIKIDLQTLKEKVICQGG